VEGKGYRVEEVEDGGWREGDRDIQTQRERYRHTYTHTQRERERERERDRVSYLALKLSRAS
jgi:hypothetical protein